MNSDICECGGRRVSHPIIPSPDVLGCVDFVLDRKATWNAERDAKRARRWSAIDALKGMAPPDPNAGQLSRLMAAVAASASTIRRRR